MQCGEKSSCVTLHSFNTVQTADAVEWCPTSNFCNILLCATYQLQNSSATKIDSSLETAEGSSSNVSKRTGKLMIFDLCQLVSGGTSFSLLQSTETAGVLDIKWSQLESEQPLFAAADSNGDLSLWSLVSSECSKYGIELIEVMSTDDNDALALSLDWSTAVQQSDPRVVVSNSVGIITVIEVTPTGLIPSHQWKGHDLEAWIAAFNYHNTNVIYTGADDCKLKVWDIRSSTDTAQNTLTAHSMGVCSIQANQHCEHIFASGSYDERVLIWDTRQLKQPISEHSVGGGVWRLKWDPINTQHLLCACMHNGSHLLHYQTMSEGSVVASYMEHESLVYGVDWCRCKRSDLPHCDSSVSHETVDIQQSSTESNNTRIIASCSFYDCQTRVWSVDFDDH